MNPPFENLQDIDHVRHAYSLLNPEGRVVSIMSTSPFFRTDKKAVSFREWLNNLIYDEEDLPAGSFYESNRPTGVSTKIITIYKKED